MADFEKVYSLEFDTTRSLSAAKAFDKTVKDINKSMAKLGRTSEKTLDKIAEGFLYARTTATIFHKSVDKQAVETGKKLKKNLEQKLQNVQRELKKTGKEAKINFDKIGAGIERVGSWLTTRVTLPLIAAGGASLKFSMDLNKGMANVATLIDGPISKVEKLKTGIQDMSVESGKSTDDLVEGLYEVVSAFGDSAINLEQLNVASKASVAGRATTIDSVKLLSAVTKAYGDTSVKAMENVGDLAFKTVELGQTTYPELAASMGKVTPLAAAMNTSQRELFGTIATLTGVTGNASEVTTQMSSVYSSMLKPTDDMKNAIRKYNKQTDGANFKTAAAMMKTLGYKGTLEALNKVVGGNTDKLAKLFGRKEALVGALALLGGQSDEYTRKLEEMNDVSDATNNALEKQTKGINKQGHSWEITKRRMERLAQRVGDRLIPLLERLLDTIEPIIKSFEEADEETIDWGVSIAEWAVLAGPAVLLIGKLATGLLAVKDALLVLAPLWAVLKGALVGIATFLAANPVVLVIMGIIAAVTLLVSYYDEAVAGFEWFITSIVQGFTWTVNQVLGLVNKAISTFSGIKEFFGGDAIEYRIDTSSFESDLESLSERKSGIDFRSSEQKELDRKQAAQVARSQATGEKYASLPPEQRYSGGEFATQTFDERAPSIRKGPQSVPSFGDEFAMQSVAGKGGGGGANYNIGGTNITVNSGNASPERTAKMVGRQVERVMSKQLKSASRGTGAAEQ